MIKKSIPLIVISFIFISCVQKTEVKGYVYSKHGFPINGGTVILKETQNGRGTGNEKTTASTDNNGYFHFKFRRKFNKGYRVMCQSDSGLALSVPIRDGVIILDTY